MRYFRHFKKSKNKIILEKKLKNNIPIDVPDLNFKVLFNESKILIPSTTIWQLSRFMV